MAHQPEIGGMVVPGFEPVREAFLDNFAERGELGGAVCAVVGGEVVVDLWGGVRDEATGAPWSADTMTLVHSTTKGLSAMVLALLHSRGLLDYDERVAAYWPEFAQAGKEDITVRQLLAHQAGLFAFDERVDARRGGRPGPPGRGHGAPAAHLAAGRASGVPRDHARLLRERVGATHRPRPPHHRPGAPRRHRHSAGCRE